MILSSGSSSAAGRCRLSVDSSHSVTTSTPASSHQPSRSAIFAAPDPVPVVDVDETDVARPPAVAVEHQRHVPWPLPRPAQLARQPALVDRVHHLAHAHGAGDYAARTDVRFHLVSLHPGRE
jgi:hypothetical protein